MLIGVTVNVQIETNSIYLTWAKSYKKLEVKNIYFQNWSRVEVMLNLKSETSLTRNIFVCVRESISVYIYYLSSFLIKLFLLLSYYKEVIKQSYKINCSVGFVNYVLFKLRRWLLYRIKWAESRYRTDSLHTYLAWIKRCVLTP